MLLLALMALKSISVTLLFCIVIKILYLDTAVIAVALKGFGVIFKM